MAGAGLITFGVLLLIGVLSLIFGILRFIILSARFLFTPSNRTPYELNRRRATAAAFVLALCFYLLRAGAWLLNQLPPWVPTGLLVVAGVAALFVFAGLHGTRHGPRDMTGVVASLVVAGCAAACLRWQWYLPTSGPVAEFSDGIAPGFYGAAVGDANRLLPGLYLAVLLAALVRAFICVQLLGGASRVIVRAMRQRAMQMQPASASGFWAEMRESFERGRDGRPLRD